jgi:hypothetical protein
MHDLLVGMGDAALGDVGDSTCVVSFFPSEFDRWCSVVRRKEVVAGKSRDLLFRFNSIGVVVSTDSRFMTDMRLENTEEDYRTREAKGKKESE